MATLTAVRTPSGSSLSQRVRTSRRSLRDELTAAAAGTRPDSHAGPSSCALKVQVSDVSFKKSGRYFLTLTSGEVERRTSVSGSTKAPTFGDDFAFPLPFDSEDMTSLAFLDLSITVTQLAFSRGATTIGAARLHLGETARVNSGVQEAEAIFASAKGAILGSARLQWSVQDPRAAERAAEQAAAERAAAEREREERRRSEEALQAAERTALDRAASLLALAQKEADAKQAAAAEAEEIARMELQAEEAARRAASLRMAALAAERAAEEKLAWASAWAGGAANPDSTTTLPALSASASSAALHAVAADRVRRDTEREEQAIARMAAEEERRLAELARRENEAAEGERIRRDNLAAALRAEEEQLHAWHSKWETVLDSEVLLRRDDGWRVRLSGRQLVGLSDAVQQTGRSVIAFPDPATGRRVILSAAVAAALRARLEGRMHETARSLATALAVELPSALRAATAAGAPASTDADAADELTSWERARQPRPTASAPPGAERPLSANLRRAVAWAAHRGSGVNKVVPVLE